MGRITDKRQLVSTLHAAAELEHALCCCYLFAGFSLKRKPDEGGVTWPQLKTTRDWATQLFIVARQEMEHLGLVCNLLISIGETPNFKRGQFPYTSTLPSKFPDLTLEPFSVETMRRFVEFERPEDDQLCRMIACEINDKNKDHSDVLGHAVNLICSQTGWEFGQVWLVDKSSGSLRSASVPCVSSEMARARRKFEQLIKDRLPSKLGDGTGSEFWKGTLDPSQMEHHHEDAEFIGRVFTLGRPQPNAPSVALVFFYCTHCQAIDDGAAEDLVKDALKLLHNSDPFERSEIKAVWDDSLEKQAEYETSQVEPGPPSTIGALYREILKGFEKLDDGTLFVGTPGNQVDDDMLTLTFPEWFNMDFRIIKDLDTAKVTIVQIIEEGEGTPSHDATDPDGKDAVDLASSASHFSRFSEVLNQLEAIQDPTFSPARNLASNPKSSQVTLANTAELMSISSESYQLMLELLLSFFGGVHEAEKDSGKLRTVLPHIFLPIMSMVVRTLGESLTHCPMHVVQDQPRAGPSFELEPNFSPGLKGLAGWQVFHARLCDLSERCRILSDSADTWGETYDLETVRERLSVASKNLKRMAYNLEAGMRTGTTPNPATTN